MTKITINDLPEEEQMSAKTMRDIFGGTRTGTRNSHSRYANIKTSELLKRIERHQTLAILTSNIQKS